MQTRPGTPGFNPSRSSCCRRKWNLPLEDGPFSTPLQNPEGSVRLLYPPLIRMCMGRRPADSAGCSSLLCKLEFWDTKTRVTTSSHPFLDDISRVVNTPLVKALYYSHKLQASFMHPSFPLCWVSELECLTYSEHISDKQNVTSKKEAIKIWQIVKLWVYFMRFNIKDKSCSGFLKFIMMTLL